MPATLNTYLEMTQRLLRDSKQELLDPGNLNSYINRARREVAMRTQALRVLTPISGSLIGAVVTAAGSGYSNAPVVTVSAPDFPSGGALYPNGDQATASAIVSSGQISAIDITYGGHGYFQPTLTITDTTGTGATATPQLSFINQLNQGQEQYPLSAVDLSAFPGLQSLYYVMSVSVIFSNYRYTLMFPSFTTYQGFVRNYPLRYQYTPVACAQLGRGTSTVLFVQPIPSQQFQLEIVGLALPSDLIDNQSVEALPDPFTDAVPFMAIYFGYLELQNFNAARFYSGEFDNWMHRHAVYTMPGRSVNIYGRVPW